MQFRPPGGTLRASNYREIVLIPDENPRVAVINARGSGREGINSGPVAVCEELSAISARYRATREEGDCPTPRPSPFGNDEAVRRAFAIM